MADDPLNGADRDEPLLPNRVLDTSNRRVAAWVYLGTAVLAGVAVLFTHVNLMWLTAAIPLLVIAGYHFVAGRNLEVRDMEAIEIASREAPFDVGHASATLGFVGFTAKPVWQVLAFEAGGSPQHQALVTVDALTGRVTGVFSEAVPPV